MDPGTGPGNIPALNHPSTEPTYKVLDWKVTICVSCVPAIIIYSIDFIVVTLLPRDLARNIPSAITLCHSGGQPRSTPK
jgi:hypothetical protein